MSLRMWIRDLLDGGRLDRELEEELSGHIAHAMEQNIARGMSEDEARQRAMRDFGQLQRTREDCREQRHGQWLDSTAQDVRFALRMLRRNKVFTAVAVATLAIGIGANTAIFSLVYSTLVRPLPYNNSRLLAFTNRQSLPDVLDIARASRTMESLGVFADVPFETVSAHRPLEVKGAIVGGDVFRALAVEPALGRYFTQQDNASRAPVAVVSNSFWRAQLNSDPNVLGRKLELSGTIYDIVGVMPEGFTLPQDESQVWVPFTVGYPEAVDARGAHFTIGIASLKDGATLEQARAELKTVGAQLAREHPEEARTFNVAPLRELLVRNTRTPLLVLFGAVTMVLLIACVNFSNLLLSRTAARQREFQIRLAVGARRARILRQMITESVVIAVVGGLTGAAVSACTLHLLLAIKPKALAGIGTNSFSGATFLFALGLALVCGLLFGMAPAGQTFAANASLRESPKASLVHKKRRSMLVVAECALAVMLLSGAGLLLRSFWKLVNVDPGFRPDGLLTMRVNLPPGRYKEIAAQELFFTKIDRELQAVPEVESAGVVSELPMAGSHMEHNLVIKGRPEVPAGQEPEISAHEASPKYFATMGIPLIAGRVFDERDNSTSPKVALITESMAAQYFPGQNPIGAQIGWARDTGNHWLTVVGIVGDVRHDGLDDKIYPAVYTPLTQKIMPWKRSAAIVVRTRAADPMLSSDAVQAAILRADPRLPVTFVEPMMAVMAESLAERRFNLVLLSGFAVVALALAIIGVYGVISYLVTQRTQEIGIRMALGAQRTTVVAMIMSEGLLMTATGVGLGALGGLALLRLVRVMLYGVTSNDPVSIGGAALLLVAIAALACYFPARRASQIDPVNALRVD